MQVTAITAPCDSSPAGPLDVIPSECKRLDCIDSSGIAELIGAFTTVRNHGGDLKLLDLTNKVHDMLQVTKLYTVLDVKDDEADAIKSFNSHSERLGEEP